MQSKSFPAFLILAQVVVVAGMASSRAADSTDFSNSAEIEPYIESLRKKHDIKPRIPSPKEIEQQAESVESAPAKGYEFSNDPYTVQPYIESVKQGLPEAPAANTSERDLQPYIEQIKNGRQLEPKFKKTVDQAAGFSVVANNRFDLKSDKVQANAFESVYTPNEKYSPSLDLFYEWQLYRSRHFGSIGPVVHLTYIFTKGKGIFTRDGTPSADTTFKFQALPISAGFSYRLSQLRFIQPFIQGSLVGIPFIETRDDGKPSRRGISRGVSAVGGIAFNLDWIGRKNAWDQYDAHGILHTYFVVQKEYLRTIGSTVRFNYDGLYAGLMFEF